MTQQPAQPKISRSANARGIVDESGIDGMTGAYG
jgi:hypothetical protein